MSKENFEIVDKSNITTLIAEYQYLNDSVIPLFKNNIEESRKLTPVLENIFKANKETVSDLIEAKNDFEELITNFNVYKENSKKELKSIAIANVQELEKRAKDTKTKKLEELEAINKEYILHIQDLNEKLGANKTLFEDKLDKLKATYEIVNKNYSDFTKDFNKKNWYLITFVLLACSITAFFCGFMIKHQLTMTQLKSSVPLSTFQSVLPFIKPFF